MMKVPSSSRALWVFGIVIFLAAVVFLLGANNVERAAAVVNLVMTAAIVCTLGVLAQQYRVQHDLLAHERYPAVRVWLERVDSGEMRLCMKNERPFRVDVWITLNAHVVDWSGVIEGDAYSGRRPWRLMPNEHICGAAFLRQKLLASGGQGALAPFANRLGEMTTTDAANKQADPGMKQAAQNYRSILEWER